MRFLLLLAVAMTAPLPATVYAQPDTAWTRTYDGEAHMDDAAAAIAVDPTGNAYVVGQTTTATATDYLIIKYRPNGDTAWMRTYDGPANGGDAARAVAIDGACNVYVTGSSKGVGTGDDFTTIKYDSVGNQLWVARYTTPGDSCDVAQYVVPGEAGSVYVAGCAGASLYDLDYLMIRYGPTGDTLWVRRFSNDSGSMQCVAGLSVDSAGNVYVTGCDRDGPTAVTVKYDPDGNLVWSSSYTPADVSAIAAGEPELIYVGGSRPCAPPFHSSNVNVIAYNTATGDTAWVSTWDVAAHEDDWIGMLAVAPDGSLYGAGFTVSDTINEDLDYLIIKWQRNGDTAWVRTNPGFYPGGDDELEAIAVDSAGNVYVTGSCCDSAGMPAILTAKYDADGTEEWRVPYRPDAIGYNGHGIALHGTGGSPDVYVVGAMGDSLPYSYDCVTIKYAQPPGIEQSPSGLALPTAPFTTISRGNLLMPSASGAEHLESVLLNVAGRRVATLWPGPNDVSYLSPGVYFVRDAHAQTKALAVRKVVLTE
jgi:hypothetical protein